MMKPNMFGSNNNTEINQLVLDHVNPSSMQEHQEINSYDLHFPNPFLDDDDDQFLSQFLSQQQLVFSGGDCWKEQEQEEKQEKNSEKTTRKKKCSKRSKIGSSTKRTGKKDRHSKICTAQGPRDRRMRLSLQIARKFFDLQDMLGFDKASKTIEWLLSNSNSAIKDLKHSLNNNNNNSGHSYGSVCSGSSEVVSETIRDHNNAGGHGGAADKKTRQLRTVARESRDRARARARQRTLLKKTQHQTQSSCFNFQHLNSELQDFPISDHHHISEFPPIHTFFSGNNNNNNTQLQSHDYYSTTLSCPSSIFKPYSFSDSTLLKLP